MPPKESTPPKPPAADKETLEKLEGQDKSQQYEQARYGVKKADKETLNQLSSSGKQAQDKRGK